ncbi:MAG: ribonuclease J [Bacilli bacterium]
MTETVRIFALGGLDEDGKNLYVLEAGNDIFIIEAGAKYPDSSKPGIDCIIANYDYLLKNKGRVRAYIITHGHDDLIGALPYMYKDIPAPIYASKATIMMIEGFTKRRAMDIKYNFVEIEPSSRITIANRTVRFFQTCHAMMLSSGVAIKTEQGYVVYSGDFLVEYNANPHYRHDLNALAKIAERPILALLSESEGAEKAGYTSPNHRLTPHITAPFQDSQGRVFISLYNQSTYHLEEIIDMVKKHHKKLYLYDEYVRDYFARFNSIGMLKIPQINLVSPDDLLRVRKNDMVILMMAQGDDLYREIEALANGENEDKRIVLNPEDTFIVAAPPAPNFELLATDAIDCLYQTGVKVYEINRKMMSPMHASEEDLKMMISLLKPQYYIPVKGEYKQLMANAKLAVGMDVQLSHNNIFLLDNGMTIKFTEGKARLYAAGDEVVPTGDLYIDGTGVGDTTSTVLDDRTILSDDGVIVMGIAVSKSAAKVVAGPDIQMRGFVFVRENDAIINELTKLLVTSVNDFLKKGSFNADKCAEDISERAKRFVWRETRRSPMILPLISVVD